MTITASSTLTRRDVLNGVATSSVVIVVGRLTRTEVLAHHGAYRDAFLWLGVPAVLTIVSALITAPTCVVSV